MKRRKMGGGLNAEENSSSFSEGVDWLIANNMQCFGSDLESKNFKRFSRNKPCYKYSNFLLSLPLFLKNATEI